jgi:hypothetical protein
VRSPLDRADFLALLAPLEARFRIEVYAYAVMATHFHLLLRSRVNGAQNPPPDGDLRRKAPGTAPQ